MLRIIVTVDRNWAITKDHKALVSLPDNLKYVRDTTYGQVILMGRHTFEYSFQEKVLPNRTTMILSKDPSYQVDGAQVFYSLSDAMKAAEDTKKDIYILGGQKIYSELLDRCDEVQVTAVDYTYAADAYFPNLDKRPEWVLVEESEEQTHFDIVYCYRTYLRRKDCAF